MTALATLDDVKERLAGDLPADDEPRVDVILVDVSNAVRTAVGQVITAGTRTDRLRVRPDSTVRLPQRHATSVDGVVDLDGDQVEYEWEGQQIVRTGSYGLVVDVTYSHAYSQDVMDRLTGIVANAACRAYGRPPESGGLTSESIGGYSYQLGAASASGGNSLMDRERAQVRRLVGTQGADTVWT